MSKQAVNEFNQPICSDGCGLCVYDEADDTWLVLMGDGDYYPADNFCSCCNATLYPYGTSKKNARIMKKYQNDVGEWSRKNFGDQDIRNCVLGVAEETGELCHAILKDTQGIRNNEDHEENAKDAVGDIIIYLMDLCSRKGWNIEDILDKTMEEVMERDWRNE